MNFKKWVKSIQTAGYNGPPTLHKYISKNLIDDGHFEVLNMSKSWSDQKLQHKTHIFMFPLFSILEEKIL
jgi:hypothetical protein